jgi:DNA-binding NarL/FixJ family response regulator
MQTIEETTSTVDAPPAVVTTFPALTEREREVALKLAIGAKNSEIADDLGISSKTVDTHRSHLLKKLGCRNNVELARLAIREGYVAP